MRNTICLSCGWYESEFGCTCASYNISDLCPLAEAPIVDDFPNMDEENEIFKIKEIMCDSYCKYPGQCSDQEELDKHCIECPLEKWE